MRTQLQIFKWHIIRGWLHIKEKVEPGVVRYWLIRHKLAMIDGIAMKGN